MNFNAIRISGAHFHVPRNFFLVMRITTVLLLISVLTVSAASYAQKITLNEKRASLKDVLAKIRQQSGYDFIYSNDMLDAAGPVSVKVSNVALEDALKASLADQQLTYDIQDGTVIIKVKEKTVVDKVKTVLAAVDVTGRVVDEKNQPISGATVRLKDGSQATITDKDGYFSFKRVDEKATIVISVIGYVTKEVGVSADLTNIQLNISVEKLSEVVVSTGYQSMPKERSTGSFETINNQTLNQRISTDVLSRLEGLTSLAFDKVASRPAITSRGVSSIQNNSNPLIVVDNFPYEGNINNINPNDIENITILKDAAAASIWGTRAGNGVIIITTKKGRLNQPLSLEFNANLNVTGKPDLSYIKQISSSDVIDLEKFLFSKGYYSSIEASDSRPALSTVIETLIAQRDKKIPDNEANQRIDALRTIDGRSDFDKYVYQAGVNQQYALSAKGGSNNVSYLFSGGLDKNVDPLAAGYNRINIRAATTFIPVRNLEITTALTYTQSKTISGRTGFGSITALKPYDRLADDNGNAFPLAIYRKPYTDTAGNGKLMDWRYYPLEDYKHNTTEINLQSILANLSLRYRLFNGFYADIKYQYERQSSDTRNLQDGQSFYTRDLINKFTQINSTTGVVQNIIPVGGIIDNTNADLKSNNLRGQLNYDRTWEKHNLTAIAGAEIRDINTNSALYRVYGYNDDISTVGNVDFINSYTTYIRKIKEFIPQKLGLSAITNHYLSQYANLAYTYDTKYTFTASARRDASNLFGVNTNDKWQPLWSSGLAWNISNEKFYGLSSLPLLRLRITYGVSGNVDQSKSAVTTMTYSTAAAYTNYPRGIITQYANPDLRWEKTAMFNVGVDFSSKNAVINGSIEYYRKRGTDLFGDAPVDPTTGLGATVLTKNVANMTGQGIEISVNANVSGRSWRWTPGLLFNYNTSKVTEYYLVDFSASTYVTNGEIVSAIKGYPVYGVLSYQWAGLDAQGNPQGLLNGQKSIDYNAILSAPLESLQNSGSATPTVFGALNNTFSWKGFSLSASISYKLGYYFRRSSVVYSDLLTMNNLGQGTADYADRWQKAGDELTTNVPSLVYPDNSARSSFYKYSSALVERADHVRLQYVSFSYDFNSLKKNKVNYPLQLYFNASNLGILWRVNKYHLDPDYTSSVIPPAKSVALGIRAKF